MNHFVGYVQDFADRKSTKVQVGRREILVWRVNEEFYATVSQCPHHGAPLCGQELTGTMLPSAPHHLQHGLEGKVIRCPWHNWEFDVQSGETLFATDPRRLRTYPVNVEDDQVYVELKR